MIESSIIINSIKVTFVNNQTRVLSLSSKIYSNYNMYSIKYIVMMKRNASSKIMNFTA